MFKQIMFLSLVLLSGCAHSLDEASSSIRFDDLAKDAGPMDGKRLNVSGFLKPVIGGYFLYRDDRAAQAEDFAAGLDVVLKRNVREPGASEIGGGKCAEIEGVFTAFDEDTIGTGYFRSTVGFVEASKVTLVGCAPQQP